MIPYAEAPMTFGILQGVTVTPPSGIWPVTIMGWVTLLVAIAAGIGTIIGWGRLIEKLNGYGSRLKEVEEDIVSIKTTQQQQTLALERVTAANESIMRELGAARRGAETCTENMKDYALEIGTKIDTWRREMGHDFTDLRQRLADIDKDLSARMEGLEREVRITRTRGD